ncbi:MAG: hypothetical protein IJN22_03415 [Clostridia bacterium]|nr:hypothetical protein [Clostridia bacterium]
MKKILSKGKVIVSLVSVLAILAVSMLSMFAGGTLFVAADDTATNADEAAPYPINGTWDADVNEDTLMVDGSSKAGSISYVDIDPDVKKDVSKFTAIETDFLLDAQGNGSVGDPYIIETANQFAAVALGKLYDEHGELISTKGLAFKVADNIKAFDMNNTKTYIDLSGTKTADEVNTALAGADVKADLVWESVASFGGRIDGNGAIIYGLKSNGANGGIIPVIDGDVSIRNLTVKNSYFTGECAAVFIGKSVSATATNASRAYPKYTFNNCAAYNNVVIATAEGDAAIQQTAGGILVARTASYVEGKLEADNCLVYGNIAKHSTYEIKYGLVGILHLSPSATITNSIVLDAAPHTLYYGSVAFHKSTYTNVHTNAIGSEWSNKTNDHIYTYRYVWSGDAVKAYFLRSKMDASGNAGASDMSDSPSGYNRDFGAGCFYKATDDHSNIKAATAADPLSGISPDEWTYNEGSYPTPKIYQSREYSAGTAWSGDIAAFYSAGSGAKGSPYVITTAEEFALMLTTGITGQYFVLGADIVINDTTAANWTDNAKQWFTSNDIATFGGKLDGKGYSVSGLYYSGNQAGEAAGLIPVIGNHAQISNLTIKDSVLNGKSGSMLGAVAGLVEDKSTNVIKFNGVAIEDTVEFKGDAAFGGIIGKVGFSRVWITDCISKSAGFANSVTGEAKVLRSISVNAYPFADTTYVKATGVYTDTNGSAVDGIHVISASDMIGLNIADTMPELNAPTSWKAVDGDYPVATGATFTYEGVEGEAWSGLLATGFAAYDDGTYGDGSKEKPHLIKTAEQLAYLVYNGTSGGHYKLGADIYVSDVLDEDKNGNLVDDRLWTDYDAPIGGLEWFSNQSTKTANNIKNMQFDGDGYVVYGLFFDHDAPGYAEGNIMAALFPTLNSHTTVKNVGISHAYFKGVNDNRSMRSYMGGIAGNVNDYDGNVLSSTDAEANHALVKTEEWQNRMLHINNCFIDHSCYFSGFYTGSFIAQTASAVQIENCIFTGSIGGHPTDPYYVGSIIGTDSSYGSILKGVVCFPITLTHRVISGEAAGSHRASSSMWVTTVENSYYFATTITHGAAFTKIADPADRAGEFARRAMAGLDWDDTDDDNWVDEKATWDGSVDTWHVIEGGTPIPSIFAKHRTEEQLRALSNTNLTVPEVTVSFITDTDEVVVDSMVGPMYSKISLPIVSRDGFKFTGWYVYDDLSIEYPYDYFPSADLQLFAGWESTGVTQNFENYTDTIWDYDSDCWRLNKPGAKGGYKNAYVRNGAKSMRLLDTNTESADMLLNYEQMLEPGQAYTIKFWVATDKADNPATLLTLVHNEKPVYLDTQVAAENMAVVTGLKVGEWVQYSYSFTAQTKWVSIRATAGSSLYFDDVVIGKIDGTLNGGKLIGVGTGTLSPNTSDVVTVAAMISAIVACAIVAVISKKNLVEVID